MEQKGIASEIEPGFSLHCFPAYLVPCKNEYEVGSNPKLEEEHSKAWKEYCKTHLVDDVVIGNWETDL
jgi:hypothetical protein